MDQFIPNHHEHDVSELKSIIREVLTELGQFDAPGKKTKVTEIEPMVIQETRIMDAMKWLEDNTGKLAFQPDMVAFFSKHQPTAPSFAKYRKDLRRKGFIEHTYGGYMKLTAAGRDLAKSEIQLKKDTKEASEA